MLFVFRVTVLFVVSLSCLASAFSTLFVTEGVGEGRKMEEMETKTPKMEGNSVAEYKHEGETTPPFTDIFNKVKEVMNMPPLEVATIVSAQHLLNTVRNIPAAGNSPQDTLNMLSNIAEEFNKTTQIIKLTAEYVNISSHYILNSLNQYAKDNCDEDSVKNTLKTINRKFFDVISNHVIVAVQEISEKTLRREMTGTDVLVSSAFHIVAAFQEMTNQALSLKIDDSKCSPPKTPQNSEQIDFVEKSRMSEMFKNSKQALVHKSIKKDQALQNAEAVDLFPNKQNLLAKEKVDVNPDLTIEIFPQESLTPNHKNKEPLDEEEIKIPESLKVAFLPEVTSDFKVNKQDQVQSRLGSQSSDNKVPQKIKNNYGSTFTVENVNPNEKLTMEMISPQHIVDSKIKELDSKATGNKNQKLENFHMYYYPLETNPPIQNIFPNSHAATEDLKVNYPQQNLKGYNHRFNPLKTLSLFGSYDPEGFNRKNLRKKDYSETMSEGSQTNLKNFDDTLNIENLNRQDLTVEVFSPEAFMNNGYDESQAISKPEKINPFDMKEIKFSPKNMFSISNFGNNNQENHHKTNYFRNKNHNVKTIELASSAVDSLSKMPLEFFNSDLKSIKGRKQKNTQERTQDFSTVFMPWGKGGRQLAHHRNQEKHNTCDKKLDPVCGLDKHRNNFIIFNNDCERKHYNSLYQSRYEPADMDSCVGSLLKHSSVKQNQDLKLRW